MEQVTRFPAGRLRLIQVALERALRESQTLPDTFRDTSPPCTVTITFTEHPNG